ncbi:MAG: hypothetical protein RLO18_07035, partial [Gimesia chilikensis]
MLEGDLGAYEQYERDGELSTESIVNIGFSLLDLGSVRGIMKGAGNVSKVAQAPNPGGCFVADTLVVVPAELQTEPEFAGILPDSKLSAEWNLSIVFLAALSIPVGLTSFGLLEKKKRKQQLPVSQLDELFIENDFKELWHPQIDFTRKAGSPYGLIQRATDHAGRTEPGPLLAVPRAQSRDQRADGLPRQSESLTSATKVKPSAKRKTKSRLSGGLSLVGLLCLLGSLLLSGSLFWLAGAEAQQEQPVALASSVTPFQASEEKAVGDQLISQLKLGEGIMRSNPMHEEAKAELPASDADVN